MLSSHMQSGMPKHIVNLLLLIAGGVLLAVVAKYFLTDPSFYRFGTYRADSVPELASAEPVFKGDGYCQNCHTESYDNWTKGSHLTVKCEVCHRPDQDHPDNGKSLISADSIRFCTLCHLAMPARPAAQPQIVLAIHPSAEDAMQQCHDCHDPHSPGASELAAGAPEIVGKCAKCHGKQGQGKKKNPALAGTEPEVFIERMKLYRLDQGKSKAMSRYANSLTDEEITALAKYYQDLTAEPLP